MPVYMAIAFKIDVWRLNEKEVKMQFPLIKTQSLAGFSTNPNTRRKLIDSPISNELKAFQCLQFIEKWQDLDFNQGGRKMVLIEVGLR